MAAASSKTKAPAPSPAPAAAPQPLELLPGNEAVRARLAGLVTSDRLHPCLLFEGPEGLGKGRVAEWLAQLLNCEVETEARPCGGCWSCKSIRKGHHPDVIKIGLDPEKTAPIISVKQARELLAQLQMRPYQARQRLVIIDPADAMNAESANALLKTFEEPPAATGFVLVTSQATRLLPTVRSRSQRVRFGPMEVSALSAWLQARGVEEPDRLARLADGCPGRALRLAEGEAEAWIAARDAVLVALGGPIDGVFTFNERLVKGDRADWGPRVDRTFDGLGSLARDALLLCAGPSPVAVERLLNPDRVELLEAWADALGPAGITRFVRALEVARADVAAFVNPRLLLDTLLVRLATELGRARSAA